MNFFGLGPGELMVIAVLALVVVGPKQLPSLLKQMGGWFGKAQQMQRDLRRGVDDIVRESELDGVTKTISQARNFTPAGAAERFINGELENAGSKDWMGATADVVNDDRSAGNSIQADKAKSAPPVNEPASSSLTADVSTADTGTTDDASANSASSDR